MKLIHALSAAAVLALASSTAFAAGDPDAGAKVFNKCKACHQIGPGAKNVVGPELNGLDGRKTGSAEGYNYSDANKNSGITWGEAKFLGIYRRPAEEDPRHQDDLRRHPGRNRPRQSLGLYLPVQGRRLQVSRSSIALSTPAALAAGVLLFRDFPDFSAAPNFGRLRANCRFPPGAAGVKPPP